MIQAVGRHCQLPMAAQNYVQHLKLCHTDEWVSIPGDVRELGDRAVRFFNPASSGGRADVGEEGVGGEEDVGGENSVDIL